MFVDLLERGVSERFNDALLRFSVAKFGQNGPVLDDLDAGELFEDPPLRSIEREFRLFRFEAVVYRRQAFELFDTGARVERHPFDQRHNRRRAVRWWCRQWLNRALPLLGLSREANLLLHQCSSLSQLGLGIAPRFELPHYSFWCIRSCRFVFVRVVRLNATRVRFCGSRPRLFGEKANDIGSDLIAMTPLRQENRVSRSAEKTGTHHRKDKLAQRCVDEVLVEGVEPRFVKRGNSICDLICTRMARRRPAYFGAIRRFHCFSP